MVMDEGEEDWGIKKENGYRGIEKWEKLEMGLLVEKGRNEKLGWGIDERGK